MRAKKRDFIGNIKINLKMYLKKSSEADTVSRSCYETNTFEDVRFSSYDEQKLPGYMIPVAATKDYFILRTDIRYFEEDMVTVPIFSQIKKTDYLSGDLNLIEINYEDIYKTLQ